MKKYLFFISIIIFCFSCTKNDLSSSGNEETKASYKFLGIRFAMENGDGVKSDTIPFNPMSYINKTSVRQVSVFKPNRLEYSSFKNDSIPFNSLLEDSMKVSVPQDLLTLNNLYFDNKTVLLSDTLTSLPVSYVTIDSIYIQPNTEMTFTANQINKIVTITYYANFSDLVSGKEISLRGKWTGTAPYKIESETKYNAIK